MKEQLFFVAGGTGKTGRRVVERLKAAHHQVRIGSRSQPLPFDWENSATWEAALSGVNAVYITFQPDLAIPGTTDVIEAFTKLASRLGVRRMVLLSGRGEHEAVACEEIVKANAKEWTIVSSSWFHQNFSESFFLDPILSGHVALPRAEALEPFIDADDIADIVVKCLLEETHDHQTYELTGPRLLTFEQAVSEIAHATDRSITFEPLSLDGYAQMLREFQVPEDHIWLINYLFSEVLDGRNASVTNDVEKILGRKAKDFSQYVAETAKTGVWNAAKPVLK